MRVTTLSLNGTLLGDIQNSHNEYAKRILQASSGEKYLARHEGVSANSQAASVLRDLNKNTQWADNVSNAVDLTTFTDAKASSVQTWMQRVNELVTEANDGTQSPTTMKSLGEEVDQIIQDLYQTSNSTYAGSYVFAGKGVNSDPATTLGDTPFVATYNTDGSIATVTYNASDESRVIQTGDNSATDQVDYGLTGGGTDGLFASTDADPDVNIFANLISIRDQLLAGDIPAAADMETAQDNLDHVIQKYVDNGVTLTRLTSQAKGCKSATGVYTAQKTALVGADVAQVATELAQWQAAYNASLQVTSTANQTSLLDYI